MNRHAAKAEEALAAYLPGEDLQTAISDLICDLRHLLDTEEGNDWYALLATADLHYHAEARVPYEDADQRLGGNDA